MNSEDCDVVCLFGIALESLDLSKNGVNRAFGIRQWKPCDQALQAFIGEQFSGCVESLTSLRLGDILRLNIRDNIRKEGLYVETGKTRRKLLFTWSRELRNLVERCKALRGKVSSLYLICTRDGQKYTEDGFKSMWQRLMRKALAESVIKDRFSFNDLRAKAASDAEPANAPDLLGHDDPRTTNRIYRRAPRRVTPIRPKIFDNR